MTRRRKILLLSAGGLIAVVAVCFFCLREKEPSYNGRTLSEWLDDINPLQTTNKRGTDQKVVIAAVRAIGPTNALPFLRKWDRGSRVENGIGWAIEQMPKRVSNSRFADRFDETRFRERVRAYTGYRILGIQPDSAETGNSTNLDLMFTNKAAGQ